MRKKGAAGRNNQPLRRGNTPLLLLGMRHRQLKDYCDTPIVTYLVSVSNVSGLSVLVVLLTVR